MKSSFSPAAPPPGLDEVQRFWEAHPLFALESGSEIGTVEFFKRHDEIRGDEAEAFSLHTYEFDRHAGERVLDLGCGIGWLSANYAGGRARVVAVDLTRQALALTRARLRLQALPAILVRANAERLPFARDSFDFLASAGVLHHIPDTAAAVREAHRVLKPAGRGMISLYYRHWLLHRSLWPVVRFFAVRLLSRMPGRVPSRKVRSVDDFTRLYDGAGNPIGKSYDRAAARALFSEFAIEREEIHYFPKRLLPFASRLPRGLHRWLDRWVGTMIYLTLHKKPRP